MAMSAITSWKSLAFASAKRAVIATGTTVRSQPISLSHVSNRTRRISIYATSSVPRNVARDNRVRYLSDSSSGGGIGDGIRGWMDNRRENQEQEQYMGQMQRLSDMSELTLANYKGELERGLSSWGAKLTFWENKELKTAKTVVQMVESFIQELGEDATADDLIEMDRLTRLKVATLSNKTVEEISIMVAQFQNMDLMQKALRKRKKEGKAIPPDAQSMQEVIKNDAVSLMSKQQKELIKKRQIDMAKRNARRKR